MIVLPASTSRTEFLDQASKYEALYYIVFEDLNSFNSWISVFPKLNPHEFLIGINTCGTDQSEFVSMLMSRDSIAMRAEGNSEPTRKLPFLGSFVSGIGFVAKSNSTSDTSSIVARTRKEIEIIRSLRKLSIEGN